ncbi:nascent polypeptide-associated complex protein [Sulfurisphaera javensis]|uniref:Nascent polypeptide-associated complex protein n=2 Tax=Sulfurisphaera javensis TaxID=2049879 RepID=A0AAT9GP49_9CREN
MKPKPNQFKNLERMLGLKTEQLDAVKVTIELKDKVLVIENPTVVKMIAQGQEVYSVIGSAREEAKEQPKVEIKDEDVKFVMEQTGKSEKEVREALEKSNGDIAKAILLLTGQET